jgi:hypothetical protein
VVLQLGELTTPRRKTPDLLRNVLKILGNVYRVLLEKPEGKRPLRRPRRAWEYGIKMDLRDIGWGGVEWIHLAQDRDRWRAVVNAVMNLRFLTLRS